MMTDIAHQIGQTLTGAVMLPPRTVTPRPARSGIKRVFGLKQLFGLPVWLLKQVRTARRVERLEGDLMSLPEGVLADLNLNRQQFRDRSMINRMLTGFAEMRILNGWYR